MVSIIPRRITPAQIRAARGMLGWSALDLARAAAMSIATVKRIEAEPPQSVSDNAFAAVQAAFESAGVRFLTDEGDGVGVRLQVR